ncbi:MAG: hypothetical protein JWM36_4407 [Hyphomicrobiales bacterium]|jgi:hypothetical protein|nr:hypothetical protein [Hyphomicrobiales bacterium]
MADSSGSSAILGVIVGAIIVVAIAVYAFGGFPGGGAKTTTVNVTPPAVTGSK